MIVSQKMSTKSRFNHSRLAWLTNAFKKSYLHKIDGTGLAIFRIVFCAVQLAEIIHLAYFYHLIYDVVPYVEASEIDLTVALKLWACATTLLLVGLFTRAAAIANYVFTIVFFASAHTYTYNMFCTYQCLGFLFMFLPVARCLSLDRLLLKLKYSNTRFRYMPDRTVSQLAYYVPVVVGMAFVYFDSILYKLVSSTWLKGLGMWIPSSLPFATQINASLVLNSQVLVMFMGYLTMIFEFLFIFLFPFRRYRTALIVVGLGLHIGILLEFPIPLFAIGFGSLYLLMVPTGIWQRLFAGQSGHEKLTFYYDAECPLCARTRLVIEHFDFAKAIRFRSVQAYASQEPALIGISQDALLDDVYSVDAKGKKYSGVDTYAQVLSAIAYLKPLSWVIRTPGIYQIAKAVYGFIASNRTTERCTEDNCGYVAPVLPPRDEDFKILEGLTLQQLKMSAVAVGLVLLVFFQCLVSYNTPVFRLLSAKSGLENTLPGRIMRQISSRGWDISHVYLGIVNHALFLDHHYAEYRRVVAITYTDSQGVEQFLPITRKTGQPGPYQYGPLWCKWAFGVMGAHPQQANLEKGIRDITAFWAIKHGMDLSDCRFQVKVKRLDNVRGWQRNFLTQQLAHPWEDIGSVVWKDQKFYTLLKPIASF